MDILQQILVQGLILGVVYAIIALGYTMVYGVLQLINFAHSEVFATGAVVGFEVLTALQNAPLGGLVKVIIALISAMVVAGLLNIVIERLAYRPLRNAPKLVPLITAIGVSFLLQDLLRLFEGVKNGIFDLTYPIPPDIANYTFGESRTLFGMQYKEMILMVIAVIMLVGLNYLVNRTKLGTAIRAVAQDRQTAGLMGINSNNIIALTFFIGGALGGVAGVLWGLEYTKVNAYVGIIPGIKSFTAAVLGGIGSIPGAMLGGIVLGILETVIGSINLFGYLMSTSANGFVVGISKLLIPIGSEYKDVGAFIALIVILIFRPAGLLGKSTTEKV